MPKERPVLNPHRDEELKRGRANDRFESGPQSVKAARIESVAIGYEVPIKDDRRHTPFTQSHYAVARLSEGGGDSSSIMTPERFILQNPSYRWVDWARAGVVTITPNTPSPQMSQGYPWGAPPPSW